jgi:hypothetical protein
MTQETLYKDCPLCLQAPISLKGDIYQCDNCGVTLKERSLLGILHKGQFSVEKLPDTGDYETATTSIENIRLPAETLKVVLSNIYKDAELVQIARGDFELMRPVQTILAQIILEQLREECFVNVIGVRRGFGPPLPEDSSFIPQDKVPVAELQWQDEGNLFCTTNRLVLPSDQFTFIRLGRKVSAVKAFTNSVAIQLKGEAHATYFVGCYPHESALVAAYVMGRVPLLRPKVSE